MVEHSHVAAVVRDTELLLEKREECLGILLVLRGVDVVQASL